MSTAVAERSADAPVSRGTDPRVPVVLLVVAVAVLAVNTAVLFAGAWGIGVTIDEPYHVDRLSHWFSTGWYLPEFQMNGAEPDWRYENLFVYAPVSALVAHAVAVVLGAEAWGTVLATPEAYAARHIAIALLAVLGLVAAASIVRLLLRSWRWAVVAAAVLSCIPTWLGHGMFNIKDAPVATGYTVVTLAAVALGRHNVATSRRVKVLGIGALALGVLVLVGTRPGTLVAVGASGLLMLALTRWQDGRHEGRAAATRLLKVRIGAALVGLAIAYLVLLAVYPELFGSPSRMFEAFLSSADFPWTGTILTAGVGVTMPPPPWYLPAWFLAQTPIVVLLLAGYGAMLPFRLLRDGSRRTQLGIGTALVALQAFLLPVLGILTRATFYDGTRQVLFALPALAVLATVAARELVARWSPDRPRLVQIGAAVVALGLVVPTVTAARLFPYSYTWFNGATAIAPIDGKWMTDYWWASDREVTPLLPAEEPSGCYLWKSGQQLISCGSIAQAQPYWPTRGSQADEPPLAPGQYYVMTFNRYGAEPHPTCEMVAAVTRPIFWRDMTMSFVTRCTVPLSPYPEQGLSFADAADEQYLLWGWERPGTPDARWAWHTSADVGFRIPPELEGQDLRLTLDAAPYLAPGQASSTLDVLVNGTPVGRYEFTDSARRSLTAVVPADVVAAVGDGRVVVRFIAPVGVVPDTEEIDIDGGADTDGSGEKKRSLQLRTLTLGPLDAP